jgi:cation diffusion facilitator CzcD-associated flavoprotein CzcO
VSTYITALVINDACAGYGVPFFDSMTKYSLTKNPRTPYAVRLKALKSTTKYTMAPLRVLISGGGIAGNTLAFWLSKIGHDVTVVERHPGLRDTGLQLDLRGHGIDVMKRMGLQEAFKAQAVPEMGIQLVDKNGRRRAFFPSTTPGGGVQNFTTEFEIMRGEMCRILSEAAVMKNAHFVFGTSIESWEDTGSSVAVRFVNGKTDTFDLGKKTRVISWCSSYFRASTVPRNCKIMEIHGKGIY